MSKTITTPEVGMLAWHKEGLDPRVITRVDTIGFIGLDIHGTEAWPCPMENYTFTERGV